MVVVRNRIGATKSLVAADQFTTEADTTPPAGKGAGFRPHELLEAALASCAAISLRMFADERGIALEAVAVCVELDRSHTDATVFRTTIDLEGDLSDRERMLLLQAGRSCPVRRTLSRRLSFADPAMLR